MSNFIDQLINEIYIMNKEIKLWIEQVILKGICIYPNSKQSIKLKEGLLYRGIKVDVLDTLENFDNDGRGIIISKHCEVSEYIDIVLFFIKNGVSNDDIISYRDYTYYNLIRIGYFNKIKCYEDLKKFIEINNNKAVSIINNIDKLEKVYNLFSDENSKSTYLRLIIKRLLLCPTYKDIYVGNQYFPKDIIHLSSCETFMDVGSYNGDTITDFIKLNSSYNEIISIEPDNKIFYELIENTKRYPNITYLNIGLGEENKKILFDSLQLGCSKFIPQIEVQDTKLSSKLVLKGDSLSLAPSFIKMDIEGAEMSALNGLNNTIKKFYPKLAICIYHHMSDLWEIPLKLSEYYSNYQLYVRHHSYDFSESVCYLVPEIKTKTK